MGEDIPAPEAKTISITELIFGEDFFVDFRSGYPENVQAEESIANLETRLKRLFDNYEFFKELYEIHGHNGQNKTLSDYAITNCNAFEQILINYKNSIILTVKEFKVGLDSKKLITEIDEIASEKYFIKNYLTIVSRLYEENELNDMPGATFDVLSSQQLSEQASIKQEMTDTYAKNYRQYPELAKKLVGNLEESFNDVNSTFAILRYRGNLAGFYRLTNIGNNKLHASSFNLKKEYMGLGFGELMMAQYLDIIAREKIILAECDPFARIASNYIERGFFGVGYGQIGEKGKLEIVRDDTKTFVTKGVPAEKFVQEFLEFEISGGDGNLR